MNAVTFQNLPVAVNAEGDARRTGVEVEFAGLGEGDAAHLLAEALKGRARRTDSHDWLVEDSAIGDIEVYLDAAWRKSEHAALREAGLRLGRDIIPVELVTEPLDRDGLTQLASACDVLRDAGAEGSGRGMLYGFGVHLNVEIAGEDAAGITRPLLAYALIEDWLRKAMPIDRSRRVLPWTAPYPTSGVKALAKAGPEAAPREVMEIYLKRMADRNHGLDMLPLFAFLDSAAVEKATGQAKALKARPAFHFRLPDCRIDEPDWSLSTEWDRWCLVERVAVDRGLLDRLADGWLDEHGLITLSRSGWAERCGTILASAGLTADRKAA
ncbi:amidoligase family protein [Pseudooceanicola sp.]|uniref:amidoligase family protein n=1 Tax=Pseudooceanicola sp. TaxID=1914328 RepID=UPI0035167164